MKIEFKNERFTGIKNISPIQSERYIAGLPFPGIYYEQQLQLIGTEGVAVVTVERKDAYGQRVTDVRSATPEEMIEFSLAIVEIVSSMDRNSGIYPQALTIALNKLQRMEQSLIALQSAKRFYADSIRSRRRSLLP